MTKEFKKAEKVGSVTPCAPFVARPRHGAHGVTRPTTMVSYFVIFRHSHTAMSKHFFNPDPALDIREVTRRQFFGKCAMGLGSIALASLLSEQKMFGAPRG